MCIKLLGSTQAANVLINKISQLQTYATHTMQLEIFSMIETVIWILHIKALQKKQRRIKAYKCYE